MYDIIIVGAGIAGLTASIYASRANKKVLIIEKSNIGGRIVSASHVKNYPGYREHRKEGGSVFSFAKKKEFIVLFFVSKRI